MLSPERRHSWRVQKVEQLQFLWERTSIICRDQLMRQCRHGSPYCFKFAKWKKKLRNFEILGDSTAVLLLRVSNHKWKKLLIATNL